MTSRAAALFSLLLSGCVSAPISTVRLQQQFPPDMRIVLVPASVDARSLRRVLHNDQHDLPTSALNDDTQRVDEAVLTSLCEVAPCAFLVDEPSVASLGKPVDNISVTEHVETRYLHLRVTDYGETPRRWKTAYITFEVVTTAAIGAELALYESTGTAAGAYVAEEGAEELAEGYTGFGLLNRLSRPVRVEADVVDAEDRVVWHCAHTGLSPWHWRNLWHMDDATRDSLLTESTHRAIAAVIKDLELSPETRVE